MMAPHRFSVLACAAFAVATPFAARALPQGGVSGLLLHWPARLLAALPAPADGLKTSAIHLVLLYFAGYLLAGFVAGNLAAALARRLRPKPPAPLEGAGAAMRTRSLSREP